MVNLNKKELRSIKKINKLFDEAENIFNTISNETQDNILQYHNSQYSLNHAIRWGLQASDDLIENSK